MTTIVMFKVDDLRLDPDNPRLPEGLKRSQTEMLRYLYEHGALDELAQSYLDNGFFPHEPILVLKHKDAWLVVEGNRRLAALMVLHGKPEAEGLHFAGIEPKQSELDRLRKIPAFEIANREDAHRYLGFRHIGGIKTWDADAKARYLKAEVERAAGRRSPDPFREVGRRVGSNAQGVRNSFVALMTLQAAREDFGIDVAWVMEERFGVWLRCMNSPDIKKYIGLDSPRTYRDVVEQLKTLNGAHLREVVGDLTPAEGATKAVVYDSRQVTDYGRVIASASARKALRRFGDLVVAVQLLDYARLPARLMQIVDSCKVVYEQLPFAEITSELKEASEHLAAVASSIRDLVQSRGKAK